MVRRAQRRLRHQRKLLVAGARLDQMLGAHRKAAEQRVERGRDGHFSSPAFSAAALMPL